MLNKNVFPSLQRRGGRAIKRMMPKATKVGADGVVSPRNVFEMRSKHLISIDHPVCAVIGGLRHLFIGGAATPPLQGGEYDFRIPTIVTEKILASRIEVRSSPALRFASATRAGV